MITSNKLQKNALLKYSDDEKLKTYALYLFCHIRKHELNSCHQQIILLFLPNHVQLNTRHPKTLQYKIIANLIKVTLTEHCEFIVANRTCLYEKPFITTATLLLPHKKLQPVPSVPNVDDMSLTDLHQLRHRIDNLQPIKVQNLDIDASHFKYLWAIIPIVLLIFAFYILWSKRKSIKTRLSVHYSHENQTATINTEPEVSDQLTTLDDSVITPVDSVHEAFRKTTLNRHKH